MKVFFFERREGQREGEGERRKIFRSGVMESPETLVTPSQSTSDSTRDRHPRAKSSLTPKRLTSQNL